MAVEISLVIDEDGKMFVSVDQDAPDAGSPDDDDSGGGDNGSSAGGPNSPDSGGNATGPVPVADLTHALAAIRTVATEVMKSLPAAGGDSSGPDTGSSPNPGAADDGSGGSDEDAAMQSAYAGK